MPKAPPCHVRQLFLFLDTVGWSQKRCADAMQVTPQAVNNWASGRSSMPARYRQPFFALVEAAMTSALAAAEAESPAALAACRTACNQALFRWYYELQASRGVSDQWHADLGKRLAVAFKTPLSQQSPEAWRAQLDAHLEAAHMLRRLLRLHDREAPATDLERTYGGVADPLEWLHGLTRWALADPQESDAAAEETP
jgi:transcriptional regulator with XRE-family HTH domain